MNKKAKKKGGHFIGSSRNNQSHMTLNDYGFDITSRLNNYEKLRFFAKDAPATFDNLKPDDKGEVTLDLKIFSKANLRVFVINSEGAFRKDLTFGDNSFKVKDLRLQKSRDANMCCNYVRNVINGAVDTEIEIPNFNSCEFEIIDSIETVMKVQKELTGNADNFMEKWSF